MKTKLIVLVVLILLFSPIASATSINGKFLATYMDSSKLKVLLQINTNSGTDDMGSATFVIGFNNYSLNFKNNPQVNTDYFLHNFSGGSYTPAKVTKPAINKLWVNIDLPNSSSNNGQVVSGTNGWTDLVTLVFDIVNPNDTLTLNWLSTNLYWGIFDADNITMWNPGSFQNLSYVINQDVTPPAVLSALPLDSTTVEVRFSEPLDSISAKAFSNYSINNGISVSGAYLSANLSKVTLTTTPHTGGQSYIVTVRNVRDLAGNAITAVNNSAGYFYTRDVTPPQITGVTVTNNQSIVVNFSEMVDYHTAINVNNYSISGTVSIISAQLLPDSIKVRLKTTRHAPGKDYNLTISGIKDRSGNVQSPNPKMTTYRMPHKIKGLQAENTFVNVQSASWIQNYTPDKMIDGLGINNIESRWESRRLMPDTLIFDLSENKALDSIRISFYKGDSGRLYKYSVFVSDNMKEWDTIIDDTWSDGSEWTELEFDSTNSRYIKLILLESNQSGMAGIWEFESYGVSDEDNSQNSLIPATLELYQNYPNPFNPDTKIKWQSPTASHQTIKIYDVLGNEIITLIDEYKAAGYYEVNFSARNMASGIYLYKLTSGNISVTRKMVLLR